MTSGQRIWAEDRGETLVELLAAVVILGIAGVAVVAGLQMSVTASDIHRKQTTSGAYARSYAEAIENHLDAAAGNYVPCAGADAYSPATIGFAADLPPGFRAGHGAAKRVSPEDGVAGACSGDDTGVQQIDITVTSPDGRAAEELTVILRRPCAATMAVCQ